MSYLLNLELIEVTFQNFFEDFFSRLTFGLRQKNSCTLHIYKVRDQHFVNFSRTVNEEHPVVV
jgi:hypothetical protein